MASAQTDLSLTNATGAIGDTVAVVAELSGASNVAGLEIHLSYSIEHLSYIEVSSTVLSGMTINDVNGTTHIIWEDYLNPIDASSPINIATIEYEILPDIGDSTEVSFISAEIVDDIGDTYTLNMTNGWVVHNQSTDVFDKDNSILPDNYYLDNNYPNPFNPSTVISFGLPRLSNVSLSVYNILGQKVSTLVDSQLGAGYHSYEWNANKAASGVYFYQLKADDFTATHKMLLLK